MSGESHQAPRSGIESCHESGRGRARPRGGEAIFDTPISGQALN
jgi:hypothetical protein